MKDFRCNSNEISEQNTLINDILNPPTIKNIKDSMLNIKKYCEYNSHNQCKDCDFAKTKVLNKNGGCYFRYHSPKEWNV